MDSSCCWVSLSMVNWVAMCSVLLPTLPFRINGQGCPLWPSEDAGSHQISSAGHGELASWPLPGWVSDHPGPNAPSCEVLPSLWTMLTLRRAHCKAAVPAAWCPWVEGQGNLSSNWRGSKPSWSPLVPSLCVVPDAHGCPLPLQYIVRPPARKSYEWRSRVCVVSRIYFDSIFNM